MSAGLDFLAIGEVLVDFSSTAAGPQGFPQYEALPGGAVANVAVAMARWGRRSGFLGCVGEDALGRMLTATLAQAGVDCRIRSMPRPTSLAMVSLAEGGERSFAFYWEGTSSAALDRGLADPDACAGSRIFHSGSVSLSTPPSREVTLAAMRSAKDGGAVLSFDANLRPALWGPSGPDREPLLEAMRLADIVKLSEEELGFLAGLPAGGELRRDDPETRERMLQVRAATGVELLFVTFGRDGCRWLGGQGAGGLASLPVRALDTTGAGDCFMAGILDAFLALNLAVGDLGPGDYRAMARRGVAAGALSTERRGGIPSIPAAAAIQAVIDRGP
jgi:sugar/nucleoside kinase (ribokinase family)